jgi:hypothetical protein
MEEKEFLDSLQDLIKAYPRFSRRHWITSPRFDFVYRFINKTNEHEKMPDNQKNYIKNKLVSCRFKMCSLDYHDKRIHEIEKRYKKTIRNVLKDPKIKSPITMVTIVPEIIFEFEAFLFQCKAFLDIYSQAIGNFFNQKPSNIKKLKSVLCESNDICKTKILNLLEKNKWLNEFQSTQEFGKTKRDIVAHYSTIQISPLNIIKKDEKKFSTVRTRIDNKFVLVYTRQMISKIKSLLSDTLVIIENNYLS